MTALAWPTRRLGDLAEFRNGLNYTKANFGSGIRVINVGDFGDRILAPTEGLEEIRPDGVVREECLLASGDILFVRSNGNRELIGRSLLVRDPCGPLTHSAFTIRARFTSQHVNPRFFAYLFRSRIVRDTLSAQGNGTNISNLNQGILENLIVPYPPPVVQDRIVEILSAYDDLLENNATRIQILEEMTRALYSEWFVEFRFPGHKASEFVENDAGRLPKGWAVATLGASASYINRGVAPKYEDDGPELVINQRCIRDQRLSLEPARRHRTKVPAEKYVQRYDVLINSTGVGTLGRVTQVMADLEPCTVDTHVTITRPAPGLRPHFWGQALLAKQAHFEAQGAGATGQTELGRSRIAETPLVVPPEELQDRFDQAVAPIREAANSLLAKQRVLQATRDLLLPRLVSGQIELST